MELAGRAFRLHVGKRLAGEARARPWPMVHPVRTVVHEFSWCGRRLPQDPGEPREIAIDGGDAGRSRYGAEQGIGAADYAAVDQLIQSYGGELLGPPLSQ